MYLELTPEAALLAETGDRLSLSAAVRDARGQKITAKVDYTSLDPAVAIVDGTGTVTGLTEGVVAIVGTSGVAKDTAVVAVAAKKLKPGSASVAIYPTVDTIPEIGGTITLTAIAREANGRLLSSSRLTWESLTPNLLSVDRNGRVVALSKGMGKVRASISGAADTAIVHVAPAGVAPKLVITPAEDTIPTVGGKANLKAAVLDGAGAVVAATITWSSLDGSIATVNHEGVVVGVAKGLARIRATSGTLADTARVWVAPSLAPAIVAVQPVTDTIAVNGTSQLSATVKDINGTAVTSVAVTWTTSNASVATVSSTGLVKGMSAGTAHITAKAGEATGVATIVVKAATGTPGKLTLSPEQPSVAMGDTMVLVATVTDTKGVVISAAAVTWENSNPIKGTLTGNGTNATIKGLEKGEFRVIAKSGTVADTLWVRVTEAVAGSPSGLTLSPENASVAIGDTMVMQASVTDTQGVLMSAATVSWENSDPLKGTVTGQGSTASIKGLEMGEFRVIAKSGTMADTVLVRVTEPVEGGEGGGTEGDTVAVQVAVSPKVDTIPSIGGQISLSGRVLNNSGASIDGLTVTWSSLDVTTATVDNLGMVSALKQGTARIVAAYGTMKDTAVIYVQPSTIVPVATTMQIIPDSVTLGSIGMTTMLIAQVRDQTGATMSGMQFSWTSLDPTIATVSNGVITAVKTGKARVRAVSGSLADTAVVVVVSSPPPGPGYTVDLQLVRFAGTSGTTLVSSAIPLPPGVMRPGDEANVHVLVNGQEQAIHARALAGRFADGSLRSVLVQFDYNLGSSPVPAKFVISTARTTGTRAEVLVSLTKANPLPTAVALPTDPNYLMSTHVVGPTVGVAEADAFIPLWQSRFHSVGDGLWAYHLSTYTTIDHNLAVDRNYYDRGLAYFAYWVRSGDAEAFKRAVHYTVIYREMYARPNSYKVQPYNMMIEGMALLYTLLGEEEGRRGASLNAVHLRDAWLPKLADPDWMYSANRPMARVIEAFLVAMWVDAPSGSWPSEARKALTLFLAHQSPDGGYRYPAQCNYSNNFQTGLFNDALIRYYEEFEQDPRIVTAIEKNNDWMWNTQWVASGGGFKYSEGPCNLPGAGANTNPAPDLNLLHVTSFGFAYQQTRDAKYRQWGDTAFSEGIKRAWLGNTSAQGNKQFNQQYRSAFRYFFYRR
jgi:hypothetical protein